MSLADTSHSLSASVKFGKNCPKMTCTDLSQLIVSLIVSFIKLVLIDTELWPSQALFNKKKWKKEKIKKTGPAICLALTAHQTSTFTGWRKTLRLDVDSVNPSRYYFVHLCISASETKLHQTVVSIVDRYHLQWQTALNFHFKNELC
jgi:hypothetical protein